MADRGLDVLEKYDFEVKGLIRGGVLLWLIPIKVPGF